MPTASFCAPDVHRQRAFHRFDGTAAESARRSSAKGESRIGEADRVVSAMSARGRIEHGRGSSNVPPRGVPAHASAYAEGPATTREDRGEMSPETAPSRPPSRPAPSPSLRQDHQQRCPGHPGQGRGHEPAVLCLVSEGHLLLEDVVGAGKTSSAKAPPPPSTASSCCMQFTPDLLPSDVVGVGSVFDRGLEPVRVPARTGVRQRGPGRRDQPRLPYTQSALLESMAERRSPADGQTHRPPFLVIALRT